MKLGHGTSAPVPGRREGSTGARAQRCEYMCSEKLHLSSGDFAVRRVRSSGRARAARKSFISVSTTRIRL